jgi:hypothetical protein
MPKTTHSGLWSSPADFLKDFHSLNARSSAPAHHPAVGRPPKSAPDVLVAGLAWHCLQPQGTLAHNLTMLTGISMSDSALSERRQSLGVQPWSNAMETVLTPCADPLHHPQAFYKGFRLVGVDGTTWNVANTPAIKAAATKTETRRGKAAFHRIGTAAAVELGTHTTIAVRIGLDGQSEGALATDIADVFTADDMVIGDRYYGSGKWAGKLNRQPNKPRYLLRVKISLKSKLVKCPKDGSRLIKVWDPEVKEYIILREIYASVMRNGHRSVRVRLWTNLLDHKRFPARELAPLYALRWEQEIAFGELKKYVHDNNLLQSHTLKTAAQEICALFMAQAMIGKIRRMTAMNHKAPLLQISFEKTLDSCRKICWILSIAGDIISQDQMKEIIKRTEISLVNQMSKPRRKRSCPRKVRQPVCKWPRLRKNEYEKGAFTYEIKQSRR